MNILDKININTTPLFQPIQILLNFQKRLRIIQLIILYFFILFINGIHKIIFFLTLKVISDFKMKNMFMMRKEQRIQFKKVIMLLKFNNNKRNGGLK